MGSLVYPAEDAAAVLILKSTTDNTEGGLTKIKRRKLWFCNHETVAWHDIDVGREVEAESGKKGIHFNRN